MNTIEQAVYEKLTGASAITALVDGRIFPLLAPQKVKSPFIVYRRISSTRVKNIDTGPSFVANTRLQIDCYSADEDEMRDLREIVRLTLDGWRNLSAAVAVKGSSLLNDQSMLEDQVDPKLYRASMDFMITHDETNA